MRTDIREPIDISDFVGRSAWRPTTSGARERRPVHEDPNATYPRFSFCFLLVFPHLHVVTDLAATDSISNCGVGFYALLTVSTARRLKATCIPWPQITGGRDDQEKSKTARKVARRARLLRDKGRDREKARNYSASPDYNSTTNIVARGETPPATNVFCGRYATPAR